MKKVLCVIIAVVIALSSMSVVSFAATKVPDFEIKTSTENAKVGDTVKVDVTVKKGSRLCAVVLELVYDNAYFQVVSATAGNGMTGVLNEKYTAKRVRFSAANQEELQVAAVLFTVEFKVLKTGGAFTLEAVEVCTTKTAGSSNWNDVTDETKEKLNNYSVVVECAHAVKETVVLENATCTKAGAKQDKCKECGWESEKVEIPVLPHELEETVIKKATCEETGKKAEKCKNCDYTTEEKEIPATGHKESGWITVKKATRTETGLKQIKCTVCGTVLKEEVIPVLPPYKLGDVSDDGFITAVDARMVLRSVAGLIELSDVQMLAADTNGDGEIGATDARLILQYVVGKVKF